VEDERSLNSLPFGGIYPDISKILWVFHDQLIPQTLGENFIAQHFFRKRARKRMHNMKIKGIKTFQDQKG
jgi:hypothetical protein